MFGLSHDLRLATRSLWHARGFATAVVVPLAAGLCVLAVMLAVANAYLVRPLPYPDASRLYHVMYAPPGPYEPDNISTIDWSALHDVVEAPIAAHSETFYLGTAWQGVPTALRVSPQFLSSLGVRATLGRTLAPADFVPGADDAALIGERLWRTQFGGDSSVLGRVVTAEVEGSPTPVRFRIVGVLPHNFWFGRESSSIIDVMLPLRTLAAPYLVRLKPGVLPALAERRITDATRPVATNLPADWRGVHLESMRARYIAGFHSALAALVAAAALLFLIVGGNVAILVVLRASRRRHEVDVRIALGAERRHVILLLAIEPLILGGVAAAGALFGANALLGLLNPLIEERLRRPPPSGAATIALDPTVIAIIVALALLTAVLLAIIPLLGSRRANLATALRQGSRTTSEGRPARRVRSLLIVLEVAGTVVLLAGSASLVRSVLNLTHANLGFRTSDLVRVSTVVPGRAYPDSTAILAFYQRITRGISEATSSPVALVTWPPYYEAPSHPFIASGRGEATMQAGLLGVGAGYFTLLGIPLKSGRDFGESDLPTSEPVAIISETLARELWPGSSAIGQRIRTVEPQTLNLSPQWRTIVAVVSDVHQTYHDRDLRDIYIPYYQASPGRFGTFYIHSRRRPDAVIRDVRAVLAVTDPQAVVRFASTPASEDAELATMKFLGGASIAFGAFATLLSLIGMYGVVAYAVRLREREVAIRVAVGATPRNVVAMFVRSGLRVLGAGVGVGGVLAILFGRVLAASFTGIGLLTPFALVLAVPLMLLTGALATWWPARRAGEGSVVRTLMG